MTSILRSCRWMRRKGRYLCEIEGLGFRDIFV